MTTTASPKAPVDVVRDAIAAHATLLADLVLSPITDDSIDEMNACARTISTLTEIVYDALFNGEPDKPTELITRLATGPYDPNASDDYLYELACDLMLGAECVLSTLVNEEALFS